jgi:hypothetical protein
MNKQICDGFMRSDAIGAVVLYSEEDHAVI